MAEQHPPSGEIDVSELSSSVAAKDAFARANGLSYQQVAPTPAFGGALFEYLRDSSVTDRFTSIAAPGFEVGVITGTVGGGQSSTEGRVTVSVSFSTSIQRSYGYLAIRLSRVLPNMVLDAVRNDGTFGSSMPMPIGGGQRLSLEGDFDEHFRLFCPRGYERDALYVFTPDLMALLIDESGDFDVEIVDDWMFAYSNSAFDLSDPALWRRFDRIKRLVGSKMLRQTGRYRDDRSGDAAGAPSGDRDADTVDASGQRLRMSFAAAPGGGPAAGKKMVIFVVSFFVAVLVVIGVAAAFILNAVNGPLTP